MSAAARRTLLGAIVVFALAACGESRGSGGRVESLREYLPQLETVARSWRPDAYLNRAEFPVRDGDRSSYLIAAGFQSPAESAESLIVWLMADGEITSERVPHVVPVNQDEPITQDDWSLDSGEALDAALDAGARQYLADHADNQCSFLVLERAFDEFGDRVVWWMRLAECFGGEVATQLIVIDAKTGDILKSEQ